MKHVALASVMLLTTLTLVTGCCPCTSGPSAPPKPAGPPQIDTLAPGARAVLFNGKDLEGWHVIKDDIYFDKPGKVEVADGTMILGAGQQLTGVQWKGKMLKGNYRITLQARRLEGEDFFCGLTFPAGGGHVSLIFGGWGGSIVGLSNVDDMSAVDNSTTRSIQFKKGTWYDIEAEVSDKTIVVALDDKVIIEQDLKDHRFEVWPQQEPARPLGITTYDTKGAIRDVVVTRLEAAK